MENEVSNKRLFSLLVIVLFIAFLITLFYFTNPEEIVEKIGIRNSYILLAIVSFFGGFSAGGSISFISLLVTLALSGMNPIYLGLVAGTSLAIGDLIMFYVISKGRELVKGDLDKKINKFSSEIKKRKWLERAVPFFAYIYMGFTPLPNDILILFLAAIKYPPKKVSIIIVLGNFTFSLMVALLASKGIMFFA